MVDYITFSLIVILLNRKCCMTTLRRIEGSNPKAPEDELINLKYKCQVLFFPCAAENGFPVS